ncbi:Phosphotransferase enzyme family protein [Rhodoferax sp. OV413]|nr:Phosphotransferase enzyme family protein [Rhodoferax sp. OV413]
MFLMAPMQTPLSVLDCKAPASSNWSHGRDAGAIHEVTGCAADRQLRTVQPALDLESFGIHSRDWLLKHEMVPLDVQSAWTKACGDALDLIAASALPSSATGQKDIKVLRLHGDCHPGNILWTPTDGPNGGPHFVDLDDARTGPAVQDLWMLLSGDRAQRTGQLSGLVDGYEQFRSSAASTAASWR